MILLLEPIDQLAEFAQLVIADPTVLDQVPSAVAAPGETTPTEAPAQDDATGTAPAEEADAPTTE